MGNKVHRVRVQAAGDVEKLTQEVKSSRTLSLRHSLLALSGNHVTLIKPPGWQDKNRNRVLVSLEGWHFFLEGFQEVVAGWEFGGR